MSKIITSSIWSADDVPDGLTFDKDLGVFSGTPNVPVGEYVVPVSVSTNYGSNAKDITILVEEKPIPAKVFAIGEEAERWSSGATPDSYGFRELSIPLCSTLTTLPSGFAAKSIAGEWYIACANEKCTALYSEYDLDFYSSPKIYPVESISKISGGIRNFSNNGSSVTRAFFVYMKNNNEVHVCRASYSSTKFKYVFNFKEVLYDIKDFQKCCCRGLALINQSDEIVVYSDDFIIKPEKNLKHVVMWSSGGDGIVYFITKYGELFSVEGTKKPVQDSTTTEKILNIWTAYQYNNTFFVTENNNVYARGENNKYNLGLPVAKFYHDFSLVGNYNVKKIEGNFMLTRDGKLFHTGESINGITNSHETFTHIFPEYKFYDIAYLDVIGNFSIASKTLVAIKE